MMSLLFRSFWVVLIGFTLSVIGCKSSPSVKKDTPDSGVINVSIDESFKPVMEAQIKMFESSFPNAKIIAEYKSEVDCFRDLFFDSTNRLVIVGRGLNRKEEDYLKAKLGFNPGCNQLASDAVALVLHQNNPDSLFTLASLKDLLTGKNNQQKIAVFDGLNATSTVRFIKDSILKGEQFNSTAVKALSNTKEVIDYVSQHENAIGFIGISWIGNPEEKDQLYLLNKLKLGYVRCDVCEGQPYVKPMQQSTDTRRYPLVRGLYYINKENYSGLGTGFSSFLKFERGQLIFRRSYLSPVMNFNTRNANLIQSSP
jgi:phosphate transport system substrate-binding protein